MLLLKAVAYVCYLKLLLNMVEETLASGEAAETKKLGGNASFRGGGGNRKNKKETLASGEAAETKKMSKTGS